MTKDRRTGYSIHRPKEGDDWKLVLPCKICDSLDHCAKDCPITEESRFKEDISDFLDSGEELSDTEIALLNELDDEIEEQDGKPVVQYGTEKKTITGVMRIMREEGREEGAELLEEMQRVARDTQRLVRITKKRTEQELVVLKPKSKDSK